MAREQAEEQADERANEHNIIKLNIFFNYINKGNVKNFENIGEEDKKNIRYWLTNMDLLVSPEVQTILESNNRLLEYEIYYWAIKELYYSPYKGFLCKLTRQKLQEVYLRTIKYVTLAQQENYTVLDVINYLMKSLENEAKEDSKYDILPCNTKLRKLQQ